MKKLLAMVLALVMTLSLAVSANAAFEDAKDINATYAEAVDVLAGMKVFQGYDNGKTFKPQGDITRAEVAAIVYRIYTADVKDSYVKNYETYNKFSDMAGAGWAKGYIGYCANAALVKGYPNGTFLPSGKVTGYEVLAMILRAVGYDKNNEFTGADWALHVAQIAEQNKILKNVKGIDLSAPASRELVAELLFQAIQVPTVTYTAAFGYQDVSLTADKKTDKYVKANSSLGYKNFKLASDDGADAWGRPTTVWFKDADKDLKYDDSETVYATIVATPDASFNVATSQCDICEALGEKKEAKVVEAYKNGKADKTLLETYKATATKAMVGAQGEQIEFYQNADGDYRLVVIDTYLAKVLDVVTEKTDSKSHITRDAYLVLGVFDTATNTEKTYTKQYVKGNDYAEDDYVLVNVNENTAKNVDIILATNEKASSKALVEVVSKADSFEGTQTTTYIKSNKHTVEKKDYDDACMLKLDEAGKDSASKFTWFLDQFGNLIGVVGVDNTNYAVLKDLIWKSGTKAHAEGTLVYMDGTEATEVEIKSIDGLETSDGFSGKFVESLNDAITAQGDTVRDVEIKADESGKLAKVSTSDIYNDGYQGLALYKVETDKDGKVSLQGYNVVNYIKDATIKADNGTIAVADGDGLKTATVQVGNKTVKLALDNSTKFIVCEENDDGDYEYHTYTLKTLPDYAKNSVEAYYTLDENFVSRVYIKSAVDAAAKAHFLFVPTAFSADDNSAYIKHETGDGDLYYAHVYVDGELQWVKMSLKNALTLAENAGKLFEVKAWNESVSNESAVKVYGWVRSIELVNETTDTNENAWTADYNSDYLTNWDIRTSDDADGGATIVSDFVWRLTADTKIVKADGSTMTLKDLSEINSHEFKSTGIWVVSEESKTEGKAAYVYVGEKLSNDASLKSSSYLTNESATAVDFAFENGAYTGKTAADTTIASVAVVANNKNAYVEYRNGAWLVKTEGSGDDAYLVANYDATKNATSGVELEFTVTAEDGLTTKTYTVTLTNGSVTAQWSTPDDAKCSWLGESQDATTGLYTGKVRTTDDTMTIAEFTQHYGATKIFYTAKNGAEEKVLDSSATELNQTVVDTLEKGNSFRFVNVSGTWTAVLAD